MRVGEWKRFFRSWRRMDDATRKGQFLHDYFAYRQRGIELPFEASPAWTGQSVVAEVRLGDLMIYDAPAGGRRSPRVIPLSEGLLFRFIDTRDPRVWAEFAATQLPALENIDASWNDSPERLLTLREELKENGYDMGKRAIVLRGHDNVIVDGNHRAACLLSLFGVDHRICVIRIV